MSNQRMLSDSTVFDPRNVRAPTPPACAGELRMVDLLLEARASTKMVTHDTQNSCLHMAAKNNAVSAQPCLL